MEVVISPVASVERPPVGVTSVLELAGLYGPFTFPEKLLQKIWLRRAFEENRACTTDGQKVTVLHTGRWNLLGGPDFKNARMRFGEGPERMGDVELHLDAGDWLSHRHAHDPAYDGVILHVVLFAPPAGHVTRGASNSEIPVLVLLPLLYHDLEEYAAEDAVEQLANRPAAQIVESLSPLPLEKLTALLVAEAEKRWAQKVRYASLRIQRLGWTEACHQTALDILGYRFNRAPMVRVATHYPLDCWTSATTLDLRTVFDTGGDWSLQGLRPANHPRVRLRQYATWVACRPTWPTVVLGLPQHLPEARLDSATGEVRREHLFSQLRERWCEAVTGNALGGTRFDNLLCDGIFPLLAANGAFQIKPLWFHWFMGDVPPLWRQALRQLEIFSGRGRPACHGMAQGLLGWLIERERAATASTGRSA